MGLPLWDNPNCIQGTLIPCTDQLDIGTAERPFRNGYFSGDITLSGDIVLDNVTLTGKLTVAGGSAAAPSITFTGDTDTGVYRAGADVLGLTAGGVVRMALDAVNGIVVQSSTTFRLPYENVTAAGSGTGDATVVNQHLTSVDGASGTNGVRLADKPSGTLVIVANRSGSNALLVYPHTGGNFNEGSANAAVSVAPKELLVGFRSTGGAWYAGAVPVF